MKILRTLALPLFALSLALQAGAPGGTLTLTEHNGYFSAKETLAGLAAGEFSVTVENKSGKLAGFQLQSVATGKTLEKFPLKPGERRTLKLTLEAGEYRYRCPINPTPWYEFTVE